MVLAHIHRHSVSLQSELSRRVSVTWRVLLPLVVWLQSCNESSQVSCDFEHAADAQAFRVVIACLFAVQMVSLWTQCFALYDSASVAAVIVFVVPQWLVVVTSFLTPRIGC
jgi:hypothetical protein